MAVFVLFSFGNFARAQELRGLSADTVRVGLSVGSTGVFDYKSVSLSSTGYLKLVKMSDYSIIPIGANKTVNIVFSVGSFKVTVDNVLVADVNDGDIKFVADTPIGVIGSSKKGLPALYRGSVLLMRSKPDRFNIVNELNLDDYLKGVVPNEMPVSFGIEALKAQAVAARNYTVKPRVKFNKNFDVCDTVACQVYFGQNTESPLSSTAVSETASIIALYEDEPILALYSSTAGGYTENYENAFSDPISGQFPAFPIPYLKGVPDFNDVQPLNNEIQARNFYTSNASSFEQASGYFRWSREWTASEFSDVLKRTLSLDKQFIRNIATAGNDMGQITAIEVLERGVSGKAMRIRVATTTGEWIIEKELVIRRVFQKDGKSLPSANFVVDCTYTPDGKIDKIIFSGGGFGHGVGMSQYGAGYMSKKGNTFDQILQHYYQGVSLGTMPVYVDSGQFYSQKFFCPNGNLSLFVDNVNGMQTLKLNINKIDVVIPIPAVSARKFKIKLDKFAVKGINEIMYYTDYNDGKLKVWLEVVPSVSQ